MRKKLRINGRTALELILTVVALASLAFAFYTHFSSTQPHTEFEQVRDKLSLVAQRILEAKEMDDPAIQALVDDASVLYAEAERAYMSGDYSTASALLEQAHAVLPVAFHSPSPSVLIWVPLVLTGVLVGLWLGYRLRRPEGGQSGSAGRPDVGRVKDAGGSASLPRKLFSCLALAVMLPLCAYGVWVFTVSPYYASSAVFPAVGFVFLAVLTTRVTLAQAFFRSERRRAWLAFVVLEQLGIVSLAAAICYDAFATYHAPLWQRALWIVFVVAALAVSIERLRRTRTYLVSQAHPSQSLGAVESEDC